MRNVIKSKSKICLDARRIWPTYVSLEEDEKFRKDTWNDFKGKQIIMHDMSNIPINAPSDAELNRATFNPYYGMPFGKGGIFTQLCGWQGTLEVYTGGIGDSDYVRRSGLLAEQSKFTKEEAMKNKCREIPFINTFDKGYRVILDCLAEGGQLCWQPCFKKSDERYGTYATLHTAAVAYTRSANERSVLQVKHSWLVKGRAKGRTTISLDLLCDAWLIQGFQTNFMYDPVL